MRPFDDSLSMTPDERRAAIARILAAGIPPSPHAGCSHAGVHVMSRRRKYRESWLSTP